MKKRIAIIGSGISGLSAACYAAANTGNEVHVFEKHNQAGGRARQLLTDNGYTFDMGPSWYWMPDIIDSFFADFGHKVSDFYELIPLDPQFEIIFESTKLSIPKNYDEFRALFEQIETGSGQKLDAFMKAAAYKYKVGMQDFVNKPCHSWAEFLSPKIAISALKLDLLSNFRSYVSRYFSNEKLRTLMEFPVIFLGASPQKIPALYSLMNYGGYALGTWYPMGGFYELVKAMQQVALNHGVVFHFNQNVQQITTAGKQATGIITNDEFHAFDAVIASSDYHHSETLLPQHLRNFNEQYWASRTFAPSCLIYYLGIKEKIPNLAHHTLFFENDLDSHVEEIYGDKKWPKKPLFYACCPSKTDASLAPEGHENLFLLMPLAIDLNDDEEQRETYLYEMLARIAQHTGIGNLSTKIDFKKSYCISDFKTDYNAYGGNAYGLANTLNQTAVWKPSIRNKKISNLYYTGQLTVPGPGVPPTMISGRIVAAEVDKLKTQRYEKTI